MAHKRNRTTTLRNPNTLRSDSEVDFESPITPSKEFRTNNRERPYKFYLDVREKLPEWWEEFNAALAESGMLGRIFRALVVELLLKMGFGGSNAGGMRGAAQACDRKN